MVTSMNRNGFNAIRDLVLWERFGEHSDATRSIVQSYLCVLVTTCILTSGPIALEKVRAVLHSNSKLNLARLFYDVMFCRTQGPPLLDAAPALLYRQLRVPPPTNGTEDKQPSVKIQSEVSSSSSSDSGKKRSRETECLDPTPNKQVKPNAVDYALFVKEFKAMWISDTV